MLTAPGLVQRGGAAQLVARGKANVTDVRHQDDERRLDQGKRLGADAQIVSGGALMRHAGDDALPRARVSSTSSVPAPRATALVVPENWFGALVSIEDL